MNPDLEKLNPYPFERLAELKRDISPPSDLAHIALSIGEPRHPAPDFVCQRLSDSLADLARYPTTKGLPELRQTICDWLTRRFNLPGHYLNADQHVIPVNGTREALFAVAQTIVDRSTQALVMMPNPFYQIYEGAALLAGAEPYYVNATPDNDFLGDFTSINAKTWRRCQLLYICTPGNPTGKVLNTEQLIQLLDLAEKYDFVIASDECYAEIYPDENNPPPSLLNAAIESGRDDFSRCLVFHSLSKRSNLPGMRSGFVAGDASLISKFLLYRTYHGCAMSIPNQYASIAAWQDDEHVKFNRDAYREKFSTVLEILSPHLEVSSPDAGFYLWPNTPIDDESFAQRLFAEQNITVLPGRYLSRPANGIDPGENHVRMALVASVEECREAAQRIKSFVSGL